MDSRCEAVCFGWRPLTGHDERTFEMIDEHGSASEPAPTRSFVPRRQLSRKRGQPLSPAVIIRASYYNRNKRSYSVLLSFSFFFVLFYLSAPSFILSPPLRSFPLFFFFFFSYIWYNEIKLSDCTILDILGYQGRTNKIIVWLDRTMIGIIGQKEIDKVEPRI